MKKKYLIILLILNTLQGFSIESADSLWAIINQSDISEKDKLQAYVDLSIYYQNTDFEKCRAVCIEGIVFTKKIKNFVFESSFNTRIGTTWFYSGDYDSSAVYWVKALKISENAHDTTRIMSCLNNLGILNTFTNDYKKSLEYYKKSLHYKKLTGDIEAIAITEMNIGINYHYMGNLDSAQAILFRILPIISKTDNKRAKAVLYNNLGSVYTGLGKYEEALHYYSLTEEFKDLLLVNDQAILHQNIGICYLNLKQNEKAIENLNIALELARKHDMKALKKSIYENLASFYYSTNDYKTAYDYLNQYGYVKDSILNMERDKAIKEIQEKYESEKKDVELLRISNEVERNQRIIWTLAIVITLVFFSSVIILIMFRKLKIANEKLNQNNQQLDKLNHELTKAKKATDRALEFKSQFLANMSHEIRTPLNIIIGYNTILKKHIGELKLKEYTNSIEICSYNLLQFLNDILDMSKIEAGKMTLSRTRVNLKRLIEDLNRLFLLKAEEKCINLIVEFDQNIPDDLLLDEIRLRQILFNLIGNAIKFTDSGYVKLVVRNDTKMDHFPKKNITINLVFEVIDTGIGIPKDQQNFIFESFSQLKLSNMSQSVGGSGLGLPITKRLTEMMDGTLTLESEPGKGSTFSLYLINIPLVKSNQNVIKTDDEPDGSELFFTGGTILVADDEEMNRNLIKSCFDNMPVAIFEADNGLKAYNLAVEIKPDIILMDMKMPMMDGIDAAKKIKENTELKEIPIFAFSASTLFANNEKDDFHLFEGYISKPVAVSDLFNEIARYLPHKIKSSEKS